jgi:hypothetical protein
MVCDKCKAPVKVGEERELHGQTLCEDCYIDTLATPKACDPWAVYSAKSFTEKEGSKVELTETQSSILRILKDTGGEEVVAIAERLNLKSLDVEREIAILRHMELVRAELRDEKKIIRLW